MAMQASPRSLPTRELGYGNTNPQSSFWGQNIDADELTTALLWPNNLRVYDQMSREDSQITGVMRAVTLPVRRTQYRIDPQGVRPEVVQHIAGDLGLPIKGVDAASVSARRGRLSWAEHVRMALLELRYGHMFFEQVYDTSTGWAHLVKLAPRMPRSIMNIHVAPDGGLVSIEQAAPMVTTTGMSVTIPARRLVAYVNEMEGATWTGTSMLRPAYKHWLIKDRLLRVQAQTIDRNGMGIPVYEGADQQQGNDMVEGQKIATSVRSGDNAGTAIPAGSKLTLMGVTGTLPDAMLAINYHDQQIARAMLAHILNLGTQSSSATGSYSLGSEFQDIFSMSLDTISDHICDVATQHIVEDIVDANWGTDEPAPRIVCDPIGSQHDLTAQAMQMLSQAGVLFRDKGLEQTLRQSYGVPPADYNDPIPPQSPVAGSTAPALPTEGNR